MNKHDSELIAGTLSANGFLESTSPDESDIIIFNTCSVRDGAEERVFNHLSMLKNLREDDPERIIAVSGCMSERDAEHIRKRAPYVNLIFGPSYIYELPQMIEELKNGTDPVIRTGFEAGQKLDTDIDNIKRASDYSAWIAIMRGCDNYCSYCVVPYVRGREWSRPARDILGEAEKLAESRVIEITLLGQNVNSYRDGDIDFPKLLEKIAGIERLIRIRFVTSHPKDFSRELVDIMAAYDNICEHVNLPAQSGSNRILELMNRKYSKADYLEKIAYLKKVIPDVSITTDLIVGFPGESEDDFNETFDLIRKVEYDSIFGFVYSERPGTKAAELADDVPHEVKIDRLQRVIKLQREYSLKNNSKMKGKITEVLIEKISKKDQTMICGRTRTNKVVNVNGDSSYTGKLVDVKITDFGPNSLIGEMV